MKKFAILEHFEFFEFVLFSTCIKESLKASGERRSHSVRVQSDELITEEVTSGPSLTPCNRLNSSWTNKLLQGCWENTRECVKWTKEAKARKG